MDQLIRTLVDRSSALPTPPAPCYRSARTEDAQAHAASLSAWEQHYEQISAGRFEGQLEDLSLGALQVFRECSNQSVLQEGQARQGCLTLGLAGFEQGRASFCGHRLSADTPIAIQSGVGFQLVTAPGMELVGISIPIEALQALAARLDGPDMQGPLPASCVLRALGPRRQALQELSAAALAIGRDHPARLAEPALARNLVLAISEAVLASLRPEHVVGAPPGCAATRERIVRRAREYMQAHAEAVITVPDLCAAAHTSRRALQYAFEDLLQLSPISYLRCMRLNRVRRELLRQPAVAVGDVAARWGFWHLSRFAADYRALFGELPSATRRRSAGEAPLSRSDNPARAAA